MDYFCNDCHKPIRPNQLYHSNKIVGRPLCFHCCEEVKKATPQQWKLFNALRSERFEKAQIEKCDGFKSIDIAIIDLALNLEIDGLQHLHRQRQIKADKKRAYCSYLKGYSTWHISNKYVDNTSSFNSIIEWIKKYLLANWNERVFLRLEPPFGYFLPKEHVVIRKININKFKV